MKIVLSQPAKQAIDAYKKGLKIPQKKGKLKA